MGNDKKLATEDCRFLIEKGIRAPSADNLQPWKFKYSSGASHLNFYLDQKRLDHYCDYGLLAPYITAGAVVENIRIAARSKGYKIEPKYLPDCQDLLNIADIEIQPSLEEDQNPHIEALDNRSTNRKFYRPWKKVGEEELDHLSGMVASEKSFQLLWIKQTDARYRELVRIVGEADQLRFEVERLHKEFMSILRFSPKKAEQLQDGLDLRTLEAGPMGNFLFWLASSWKRMQMLNTVGLSHLFNLYAQMQMKSSPVSGLLVATSSTPIDYLKGGELMERLWHEATRMNLSLQPMEALPIFIMNEQQQENESLSYEQQAKLSKLKKSFFELFRIDDEYGLILFFRLGYTGGQKVRSKRRPFESFMIGDADGDTGN